MRRRAPAGAARRRSARRAARPPPARRSRRRSRGCRRRGRRARARTAAASCRRPDSPATNASDGRPPTASASAAAQLLELGGRGRRSVVLVTREAMTPVSRRPPPERGERLPAAVARDGDTRPSLASAARAPTSGEWSRLRRQRCLTRARQTPYGGAHAKPRTAPGARRSTATPWPRDRGWTYSLVTVVGRRRLLVGGAPARGRPRRARGPPPRTARPPTRSRPAYSARTRVHEYGGGAYTVARRHGLLLQRRRPAHLPRRRRRAASRSRRAGAPFGLRYADLRVTPAIWLVCVRERDGEPEHVNELVALPTDGSAEPRVIAHGHDFYAAPRVSPDGTQIAWLTWDHPRMPWEGSELWVAEFRTVRATSGSSPAARRRRSSSPSGARTASCTSARTAPAGGTSTAATTSR